MSHDEREAQSSDDENVEECAARRGTRKMRAQKYLAAKATSAKAGRNLILKACGEEGGKVLDTFLELMDNFSKKHPDQGMKPKDMNKFLFKIVVKCAVFLDNGVLLEEDFHQVSIAAATFAWMLLDMCELPMVYCEVDKLQELLDSIHKGLADMLKPVVTGKSLERLAYLREHLSPAVFEYLLKDDDASQQRTELGGRILSVVETRQIPRPAQQKPDTVRG